MNKEKINWMYIILKITCDSRFRFWFKNTIKYSLINYDEKRGKNASDVSIFNSRYGDKIFKK